MWPVSAEAGIQKMRHYAKGTKAYQKRSNRLQSPGLLQPTDPNNQNEQVLNEWIERDPTIWSSPSRERHIKTLKTAKVQLNYAHLVDSEHQMMHVKLKEDQN